MNRTTRWRGGVAIAAAVAAATLGLAAPAVAATPGDQLIAAGHSISLTITKLANSPGAAGDGTSQTIPGAIPVSGAGFTIYPVTKGGNPIDLRANSGWQDAAALAATLNTGAWNGLTTAANAATAIAGVSGYDVNNGLNNGNGATTDDSLTGTTNGSGVVSWANATPDGSTWTSLQMGLYLVVETAKPGNASMASTPFLVTVPITDPANRNAWLYDVYAYPKNTINQIVKTVADQSANVGVTTDTPTGEALTYTLTVPIPDMNDATAGNGVTDFQFIDQLPSQLADVVAGDVTVHVNADANLAQGTDYGISVTGNKVIVTIDPSNNLGGGAVGQSSAITAMNSTVPGTVTVTITAKADTAGTVTNGGNDPSTGTWAKFNDSVPTKVEIPSNTVSSKYGTVVLQKYSETNGTAGYQTGDPTPANNDTPIVGAEFQLFISPDATFANAVVYKDDSVNPTTFTTDANGQISVLLRYADWEAGTTGGNDHYWFVETKSASGFELLTDPIAVDLSNGNPNIVSNVLTIDQQNVPANAGFALPLTGGFGTFVFYAVGGGIVALTVILLLVLGARRRKEHSHN